MNRIQSWLVGATSRLVPELNKFVSQAGGTMELARGVLQESMAMRRENRRITEDRAMMLIETQAMSGSGPAMGEAQFKERLWELELALEDRGWQRQLAVSQMEFSRYGIQQLILMCRLYKIKNPLIKRGVEICAYYVFGRGVEITSDDDAVNEQIERFLADPSNAKELGHCGLVEKHASLQTDGNVFFVFFSEKGTGDVKVRTIDPVEIQQIITDPDDSSIPWFYRRTWAQQTFDLTNGVAQVEQKEAWYPALNSAPAKMPQQINGKPVFTDHPVYHMKEGGLPKWHFASPPIYAAIDWADAYKNFLQDWATITRQLARFGWDVETQGGQQSIQSTAAALGTTLAQGGTSIERNPPPVAGAAFVRGPGMKIAPFKTSGATTEPEQGRRVMLQVAAAFGLPETFFGDASVGSLATSQSLDRPTELKFLESQERWREALIVIFSFALRQSVDFPKGRLREALTARNVDLAKLRFQVLREAPKKSDKPDQGLDAAASPTLNVIVKFPAILEHDIGAMVEAIVKAATLNGYTMAGTLDKKTVAMALMAEIGIDNPEEVFNTMYPSYDPVQGEGDGQDPEPPPAPAFPAAPAFNTETARMVRQLARAVESLTARAKGHDHR